MLKIVGKPKIELYYDKAENYRIIKILLTEDVVIAEDKFSKRDFFTVVGTMPQLNLNIEYEFYGTVKTHSKFGIQLEVKNYKKNMASKSEAVISFLSGDLFPGVGKKTAEKIVDTIGDNTLQRIIDDKNLLFSISGINNEKALEIYDILLENYENESMIFKLVERGLTLHQANELVTSLGENTLKKIKENPYRILDIIDSMSFKEVDSIAMNFDIDINAEIRIRAAIRYVQNKNLYQKGDSYLLKDELFKKTLSLLGRGVEISASDFKTILDKLEKDYLIYIIDEKVFLRGIYDYIDVIASTAITLTKDNSIPYKEQVLENAISKIEDDYCLEYEKLQRQAIIKALNSKFTVITGGPGTGKTTIIKTIVKIFSELEDIDLKYIDESNREIALLAPTGRAAKKIEESTGVFASTIHRFLKYENEDFSFYNSENQLNVRMIIIDEFSMVDLKLLGNLLYAINLYDEDVRFIVVGDHNQLPSIGPGTILKDFVCCDFLPKVSLETVYRQSQQSSIIDLANHIKDGYLPMDIFERKEDRRVFQCITGEISNVVKQISSMSRVKKGYTDKDIQVLSPMYKTIGGVDELNEQLQIIFNPTSASKNHLEIGKRTYREKDKVLQLNNLPEKGVMNGDIGYIKKIIVSGTSKYIEIEYDNNTITYEKDEFDQFTHAYAMSVHKSQGGEWPIVILTIPKEKSMFLTRKLIYTAVTRAKNYLFIVGDIETLKRAISNNKEEDRRTFLPELLIEKIKSL